MTAALAASLVCDGTLPANAEQRMPPAGRLRFYRWCRAMWALVQSREAAS